MWMFWCCGCLFQVNVVVVLLVSVAHVGMRGCKSVLVLLNTNKPMAE